MENDDSDRVLGARLLTVGWQQRSLPDVDPADAGAWLLISTCTTADVLATALTDALKSAGAQCTAMVWPQRADHRPILSRGRARFHAPQGACGQSGRYRHRLAAGGCVSRGVPELVGSAATNDGSRSIKPLSSVRSAM